jgi:hypothetical protein
MFDCARHETTYGELIYVFRARSKYGYTKIINKIPQICWISQRTAIIQNEGATDAKAADEKIPHHPSSGKCDLVAHVEGRGGTDVVV